MKTNPLDEGRITNHSKPLGTVTRGMVLARAREIALINDRSPHEVLDADFAQARRELTGEDEESPQQLAEESLPESERWDPVPGTQGKRAETFPLDDEQTENEKLVQEGVAEAEHDQMLEGSKEEGRRDKEGT